MKFVAIVPGGTLSGERDFDDGLDALCFAAESVRELTGDHSAGGTVGRYLWQEIWRAVAPSMGLVGRLASDWMTVNGVLLVRDRSIEGDAIKLFADAAAFHARLMALPIGKRVVAEVAAHIPEFAGHLKNRMAA